LFGSRASPSEARQGVQLRRRRRDTHKDPEVILRKQLAIPPAWEDVWICRDPLGHLQATGVDAAGRKQYRYHDRWRELRDRQKFDHMVDFAKALPKMRRRVLQICGRATS
jgi:DNA topoisomerase IB